MSDWPRWAWDWPRGTWEQTDRLADWIGPHLAARTAELTVLALATVALRVLVHLTLMVIMWMQRPWDELQRETFWFLGMTAVFWSYLLYQQVRIVLAEGLVGTYPLRVVLLIVAMDVSGLRLLWAVDRRYRRNIGG